MEINTNAREMIARRVRALLEKTTENGCTESEAMSAAQMARALMDKYSITMTEAEIEADGTKDTTMERMRAGRVIISDYLAHEVARYCDCKSWRSTRHTAEGKTSNHHFLGCTADADFAGWLLTSLVNFIRLEAERYIRANHVHGSRRAAAHQSFVLGCANRINGRLASMIEERRASAETQMKMGDGRSLIVVKDAIVNRAFSQLGLRLRKSSSSGARVGSGEAYGAGKAAGDRASFGRPINGGSSVKLIG